MTARINPIAPRLKWDVLSPGELERIHDATLEIMEEVGIRFPSDRVLTVLDENGCEVDRATQLAKLPRALIMAAVSKAPGEYVLAGRDPAADMLIDGKHCYLSNDGSGVFVFDHKTGEKRPSTKNDAATSARFVDALPNISYYWGPVVTSQDVPPATKALHDAEAVFNNTSKHFQTVTTVGEKPARYLVEMAAAIAGGVDKLRERPILSFMQCAVDPLGHDGPNLEANLVAAEHGLASGFMPMPLAAGTGPATLAGTLVVQNAEALSGVVLLQLAYPGSPCFFAGAPSVIDLRTGGEQVVLGRAARVAAGPEVDDARSAGEEARRAGVGELQQHHAAERLRVLDDEGAGQRSRAGTLVVQNAEALSGVVLLQLAYPGSPCFFAGAPSVIDLRTGGYTGGSPEDYLLAAGPEVDDARGAGEEARRAGVGELQQHHAAERLRVLDDEGAGQRSRAGAGRKGHGHEAAGQPMLGGHEVRLEVGAVVAERVHRALHEAQDRPLAQLVDAAGDGRRHLDEVAGRLLADRGHRLEVLAGVVDSTTPASTSRR